MKAIFPSSPTAGSTVEVDRLLRDAETEIEAIVVF